MATAAEYLELAYLQAAERLSEMDTLPLDVRVRMTYTAPNGQTFDWNGYRRALQDQLKELLELIQAANGPFEVLA